MIEVVAAVVGAVIGIAGVTASGLSSRSRDNREEAVISSTRLTVAVESISERLDSLHQDMKTDRAGIYKLLNEQGNRITALEARDR